MRGDFPGGGLGQAVPQVPSVADLHASGQRGADCLAVGPRSVPADDLDAGMLTEPVPGDIGGTALQDVDAAAGLVLDEHGRVDQAAPQREVVDAQDTRHFQGGKGDPEEDAQRGVPGDADAQRRQQTDPARPANSRAAALTWPVSRVMRRW